MKVAVLNDQALKVREIEVRSLPERNHSDQLTLQALSVLNHNRRRYSALTKTRGDIAGGGKKPWRQKGTGRARQGSIRSPLWRGGGVSHGPTGEERTLKINRRASKMALASALLSKLNSNQVTVLFDQLPTFSKSKGITALLLSLKIDASKNLFLTNRQDLTRSVRNIKGIKIASPRNFSLRSLLDCDRIVILETDLIESLKRLSL